MIQYARLCRRDGSATDTSKAPAGTAILAVWPPVINPVDRRVVNQHLSRPGDAVPREVLALTTGRKARRAVIQRPMTCHGYRRV